MPRTQSHWRCEVAPSPGRARSARLRPCEPTARHIQLYHSQNYRPGGSAMRRLPAALAGLAATAFLGAPALAHHSQAMFDTSKEVLIKGTVTRLEWKNPHIYLIVATVGADGKRQLVQGEGLATTQALVDGLHPEDLPPGAPV